jgi:hypothetical protein
MSLLKNTYSIYLLFQYRYWQCTVQLAMKIPIRTVDQSSHKRSLFVKILSQLFILRL